MKYTNLCTSCEYSTLLERMKNSLHYGPESNVKSKDPRSLPLSSASEAPAKKGDTGIREIVLVTDTSLLQETIALLFFEEIQEGKCKASNKVCAYR